MQILKKGGLKVALNQIPYTNVHELNLDWILAKLQEFENRLEAIENYDDQIADLYSQVHDLKSSVLSIKNSITALNARCTKLEDDLDQTNASMQLIYAELLLKIQDALNKYNALDSSIRTLRVYNDTSNAVILQEAKEYTRDRIAALLDWLTDPEQVYVFNPWTGIMVTIQQFIDYLYNLLHYAGLTAAEFDALGLTAAEFDALGITAEEFDSYGKWALFFHKTYVTASELEQILEQYAKLSDLVPLATKAELEHYATLNDIKVLDPTTGILGSVQTAIDHLADLHRNGLTVDQFESADLTCSEFDALEMTAFEFDFGGLIRYINESLISVTLGITAEQYQNIIVGAGGQLYTII